MTVPQRSTRCRRRSRPPMLRHPTRRACPPASTRRGWDSWACAASASIVPPSSTLALQGFNSRRAPSTAGCSSTARRSASTLRAKPQPHPPAPNCPTAQPPNPSPTAQRQPNPSQPPAHPPSVSRRSHGRRLRGVRTRRTRGGLGQRQARALRPRRQPVQQDYCADAHRWRLLALWRADALGRAAHAACPYPYPYPCPYP